MITSAPVRVLALLLGLASCASVDQTATLAPVSFEALPGWAGSDQSAAFAQFRRQCGRLATMPAAEALGGSGALASLAGTVGREGAACLAAREATVSDGADARRFFETWFSPYRTDDLVLAGYFEPEVPGSLVETPVFRTPVLGRPSDLVTVPATDGHGLVDGRAANGVVVPYDTRAAIDRGALGGRAPVVAWVRDPVDRYLMQKEGAGRIALPDGSVLRLGYAGQNGLHPEPIADGLVARGMLAEDDRTPAAIRRALERYRGDVAPLLETDPSYVFFGARPGSDPDQGPPGTLGVPLAPLHSLVVDRAAIPLGVPVFVAIPGARSGAPSGGGPLDVLAFAEDEGGDVGVPDRADLFFGAGDAAGRAAHALAATAAAFILVPRPVEPGRGRANAGG